ncbi:type II restriction enzyme HpaII [Jejuia pallidilutea]|uniref:Type II restriction enzyme HpaII n=1 Tax=Jejuia pallidilutea TaxID=504487 RepID=A0A090W1N0_9FLAO|nr:type II restriction enzyme HpaII [Jejuia pallidilutea]GAL70103.1 type II restriction enzyme HpaII [Jejuia pallidilutea]GAL88916.1 type II restriction enzyme HpaII [Jejuia pallidilutea]
MDRIAEIKSKDGIFEFVKTERQIFSNNLVLIDSLLPEILSQIVFDFYSTEYSHLTDLVNLTAKKNPLEFDIENSINFTNTK